MTRDYERRRLREIYDRNRRRVDTLAKSRDRNERRRNGDGNRDDRKSSGSAPRRYIVSERVTRRAGFGAGGRQGRTTGARTRRDGSRREERFADRNATRRTNRDRFELPPTDRRGSRRDGDRNRESRVSARRNRRGDSDRKRDRNSNGNNGGRRFSRGADRRSQRRQQRGGNNNNNGNKPQTTRNAKPLSGDDLNAQLEAYKNNEVFNPKKQQQAPQQQRQNGGNTFQSLDAQLDAYRN